MKTAYVVAGRLTPQGTLELDEYPPLPPGPVRVSVEAALGPAEAPEAASDEEIDSRRAQMAAAIGCLSDEDAQQMQDVIEAEFEKVDLDEWR